MTRYSCFVERRTCLTSILSESTMSALRLKPGLESTGLTVMVPGCQKNGLSSPRYIGWIGLPSSCTRLEAAMFLVQAQRHPKDCLSMLKSLQCCDVADPCQGNHTSDFPNTTSARPIGNVDIACLGRGERHQHTPMFHRLLPNNISGTGGPRTREWTLPFCRPGILHHQHAISPMPIPLTPQHTKGYSKDYGNRVTGISYPSNIQRPSSPKAFSRPNPQDIQILIHRPGHWR